MLTWVDRLRIALMLSPSLLLVHIWILASSNGYLVEKFGMVTSLALVAISSVVEAYIVVLTIITAIKLWRERQVQ